MATTYRVLHTGTVERTTDDGLVSAIPPDPANRDYAEFLAWQDEQDAPLEPEPEPAPDPSIQVSEDLRAQAQAALQANRDFLAVGAPTNAQTVAQVKALTRQMNRVIRLVIGDLSGTD